MFRPSRIQTQTLATFWILTTSLILLADVPEYGQRTTAKVIRVLDGDTVEVEFTQTAIIRLRDCWAPETRTRNAAEKKAGLAAKDLLAEAVDGQQVDLFIPDPKPTVIGEEFTFSRIVADVFYKNENVAEALIAEGAAYKTKEEARSAFPNGRYGK